MKVITVSSMVGGIKQRSHRHIAASAAAATAGEERRARMLPFRTQRRLQTARASGPHVDDAMHVVLRRGSAGPPRIHAAHVHGELWDVCTRCAAPAASCPLQPTPAPARQRSLAS